MRGEIPTSPHRRFHQTKEGFFLHLALVLIILFGMYVVSYYVFMRNQTKISSVLLSGELAHHLAQAGVSMGISYFGNTKKPPPIFEAITSRSPDQINGTSEVVPLDQFPAAGEMLKTCGENAELEVNLELLDFRRFFEPKPSPSGINYGDIEKHGTLKVTARAKVNHSQRTIVALKYVKVVQSIPYVVSKFTLFVREKLPSQKLNTVKYKKVDLNLGAPILPGQRPIFLHNGPGTDLEKKGWVFLGGGKHFLNLTWGNDGWGDQCVLLKNPFKITYDPSSIAAISAGHELLTMQRGFFEGIKADNNLFANYDFSGPADDPLGNGASILHPFGSPSGNSVGPDLDLSPTYVLGEVYRRYLDLKYLRELTTSQRRVAYLPFASLANWRASDPSPWPTMPPFDVKKGAFQFDAANPDASYARYEFNMSQVVTEAYNRGCDYVLDDSSLDPAFTLKSPKKIKHRNPGISDFLYEPWNNRGDIQLMTEDRKPLFEGNLGQIQLSEMYFAERSVFRMEAADFKRFLKAKKKGIPGIVFFSGGDIKIDEPLDLKSGGIIACEGDILIESPVTVGPAGRPLTLASTNGNIVIHTKSPVQACLLALNGTLKTDSGVPLDVLGAVVVKNLDYGLIASPDGIGRIRYDPRLDPTSTASGRYTVHMDRNRHYYLKE